MFSDPPSVQEIRDAVARLRANQYQDTEKRLMDLTTIMLDMGMSLGDEDRERFKREYGVSESELAGWEAEYAAFHRP